MTIRPIVRYPDPRLALPAQAVTAFDDALRELASDLLETMRAAPGIGITAPHIGISLRVVVLDLDPVDGARTYVKSGDHLEVAPDDPASGRQRFDARRERRGNAPCAHPDPLSRRRRQPADRGIGRPARGLPPARDRSAERDVLDQTAVPPQAGTADQAV